MKLPLFNKTDSVLLLGEGNFSFSVALARLHPNVRTTATCYETIVDRDDVKKNIEYLVNNGVRVLLGIDATKLAEHSVLSTEQFDKIIFNFPHVGGKMRIEKNRELLRQFFISAQKLITWKGQILVTLCNGQGGTVMDSPQRSWNDSWKIIEMAAHGNFVLSHAAPFEWFAFQSYTVTGYRGLDKEFHSEGAITHIFVQSVPPELTNIAPVNETNISLYKNVKLTWKDITDKYSNSTNCNTKCVSSHTYTFDMTFCADKKFNTNELYIVLYNNAGCIIDDIHLIGSYQSPFDDKEKMTYRISYKSNFLPLYRKRVIDIHQTLIANIIEDQLNLVVSR